ncbi:MAG TPA: NrfD/PsrC family molybdoenzyme membrane anchor subunit [Solirubrobacteraceae bacterium]|nr:NrfD/PsrC family molybdoenzyme membrane anchor subunit [Solirubrobacteraceae bacterium]
MSEAAVTRDGLQGVRPDREARTWSHDGKQRRGERPAEDHPGSSYYGKPIINLPVWEERDIAGYLFAGGLAGASSILAAGGELSGRPRLARRCKLCASAALGASLVALVHDLGRPGRFLNMLRVFKPTSPMSVGSWLLGAYGPLNGIAAGSDVLGIAPRAGRAAALGAGVLGAGVASYTGALIANTAVPAWHGGHRELPFVFVGSAASAGAGFALIAAPSSEAAPARRMAVLGAAGELVAEQLMERRLGMVAQALHDGSAGKRLKAAKALTAAGALGSATLARRSRLAAALSGAALLAGSALTRFGLFEGGMASARDPKYTVEPQRERIAARTSAG